MKIPIQEKIAELERRIEALEKRKPVVHTTNVHNTTTTPLTPPQKEALSSMWRHFDATFEAMRKVFKS